MSQGSWGRLEMKPKRHKGHGSGTLIASLQASYPKLPPQRYQNEDRSITKNYQDRENSVLVSVLTEQTKFTTECFQNQHVRSKKINHSILP